MPTGGLLFVIDGGVPPVLEAVIAFLRGGFRRAAAAPIAAMNDCVKQYLTLGTFSGGCRRTYEADARCRSTACALPRQRRLPTIDWLLWYNCRLLHAALAYVNPMQFDREWFAAQVEKANP